MSILTMHYGLLTAAAQSGGGNTVHVGAYDYPTVKIGTLIWTAKNLDFVWDGLELRTGGSDPLQVDFPSCCYYNYNKDKYDFNGNGYGLLYNYYAAKELNDNRLTLLPSGWRVAGASDYAALANTIGGSSQEYAQKIKSTTGWSRLNGTNDTGFNAYPTGGVYSSSEHDGNYAIFATPDESSATHYVRPYIADLTYGGTYEYGATWYKWYRASIRLVKDA